MKHLVETMLEIVRVCNIYIYIYSRSIPHALISLVQNGSGLFTFLASTSKNLLSSFEVVGITWWVQTVTFAHAGHDEWPATQDITRCDG